MPYTTEQIHLMYEMNNYLERDISMDLWYSQEEYNKLIKVKS